MRMNREMPPCRPTRCGPTWTRRHLDARALPVLLGLLLSLLPLEAAAQDLRTASPDSGRAWVRLLANRAIGRVWVDSLVMSPKDGNILQVTPGSHRIRVLPAAAENWLVRSFAADFTAAADDTVDLQVRFPEFVSINSKPFGAEVRLEETFLGQTPVLVRRDRVGDQRITLSLDGYQDATVSLATSGESSMVISLVPDQQKLQEKLLLSRRFSKKQRNDRRLALAAFGISIASGAAALWFKDQADKKYDRYRRSGISSEITTLFDDAKRFDRLSAGSYIVFEVSLVTSTYFLMRSILRKPQRSHPSDPR